MYTSSNLLILEADNHIEDFASKIGVINFTLYSAYVSYTGNKGMAFPSQKTSARMFGISIKTIIKYNEKLNKNNF